MRWLPLLLLAVLAAAIESPKGIAGAGAMEDAEREERRISAFMREAAEYRIGRAQSTPDPAGDAAVEAALAAAEDMRLNGGRAWYHLWLVPADTRARWILESAFAEQPYAARAGDVLHAILDRRLAAGEVRGSLSALERLWHYIPEHPRIGEAMRGALELGERLQDFAKAVDLDAEDPGQVVRIDGRGFIVDLDSLFRFLSRNGDRDDVAPRATLAMARSLLLSGDREDRWAARRAYEDFLERFPENPLAFDAVLEQALSHLVTYKGSDYDTGALFDAADLVDIAELEVAGDAQRAELVAAYRRRIGAWLQDRDLSVARWYAARMRPAWLTWLRQPLGLRDPAAGARRYAEAVIARDRTSRQAGEAAALLRSLPPPVLGTAP